MGPVMSGMVLTRIFVTGGTFDKEYDELTGSLFFKDTHLPEMIRLVRAGADGGRVHRDERTLFQLEPRAQEP